MTFEVSVNLWAVLLSTIASMVIGSIWYGPLFGKMFMRLLGMEQWSPEKQAAEKKKMPVTYFLQFLGSLLMFFVFAWLVGALGISTISGSIQAAIWVWLGFIVPVQLGQQLWGGKMALFFLGAGNMLLTMLAGAWLISFMK